MAHRERRRHNAIMLENFESDLRNAIETLRAWPAEEIRLFHHNDTDGLTSGAILQTAFCRAGYRVSRIALEKPYPQVMEQIFQPEGQIIIFADFAGQIAPLVSEMNGERNLVLILDHHPAETSTSERVLNLDADLHGLKGDRDISASATCALFAEILDPANIDLSNLGALGAIGDGFFVNGALSSVNREMMEKAVRQGSMRSEKTETGERYFITLGGIEHESAEVCRVLDTLGAAGYSSGGADEGIDLCINGFIPETLETVRGLRKIQEEIFRRETERLRGGGLKTTEHLQWFDVEKRFAPMGVKMIGVFCRTIRDMDFLDHSKYLAGFQTVPDEVPGFGKINFDSTKISMRVSRELTERIRSGTLPGLSSFLPEATLNIGGFADACHGLSAATTVRIGQEAKLIAETERVLTNLLEGEQDGNR